MSKAKRDPMEEMSFEEALQKLEEIVASLEGGHLPLEEAIAKFEEGTRLKKICEGRLREAERKIEVLLRDEEGALMTRPLEQESETKLEGTPEE